MGAAVGAAIVAGELLLGPRESPDHHGNRDEHQDHGDGDSHLAPPPHRPDVGADRDEHDQDDQRYIARVISDAVHQRSLSVHRLPTGPGRFVASGGFGCCSYI